MAKFNFSYEINLGQLISFILLCVTLSGIAVSFGSEVRVIEKDVARHERAIQQLQETDRLLAVNQGLAMQTLAAVKALLEEHLKHDGINSKP